MSTITPGTLITTRDLLTEVPEGATLRGEMGTIYTRNANGYVVAAAGNGSRPVGQQRGLDGWGLHDLTVVSVPEPPLVGQAITSHELLASCPDGTRFHSSSDSRCDDSHGWSIIAVGEENRLQAHDGGYLSHLSSTRVDGFLIIHSLPASTEPEAPTLSTPLGNVVGDLMDTSEKLMACPVGTTFTWGNGHYSVVADPTTPDGPPHLFNESSGRTHLLSSTSTSILTIASLPEHGPRLPDYTGPEEGGRVTSQEQLNMLPLNSVIRDAGRGHLYHRRSDGWRTTGGRLVTAFDLDRVTYTVTEVGRTGEPDDRTGRAPTVEDIRTLPVGSTLRGQNSERLFTKRADDWIITTPGRNDGGLPADTARAYSRFNNLGSYVIESVGAPVVNPAYTVGQVGMTSEEFAHLPVGAMITSSDGSGSPTYTRDATGFTRDGSNGGHHVLTDFGNPPSRWRIVALPDASLYTVGQSLTKEQFDALPIGAEVRAPSSNTYTREGEGYRTNTGARTLFPLARFTNVNRWTIASLPSDSEGVYSGPQVGASIRSWEDFMALPLGAVTDYSALPDETYERVEGGMRRLTSGEIIVHGESHFTFSGGNVVVSLPGVEATATLPTPEASPLMPDSETPVLTETLRQYKQRFRSITYSGAQRASVAISPLDRAMERLDCSPEPVTPGLYIAHFDHRLSAQVPIGSMLVKGESVFKKRSRADYAETQWMRVLGTVPWGGGVVDSIPGVDRPSWVDEVGTDADTAAIHQFKVQAWRVGERAKSENGWCGDYERAMALAGITATLVDHAPVLATPTEVCAMPVGTILRVTGRTGDDTQLYRRDARANNPCGTTAVAGRLGGTWAQRMEVLWTPGRTQNMEIPCYSHTEMAVMPVGTVLASRGRPRSTRWTMNNEHMWVERGNNYQSEAFNPTEMAYVVIP